MRFVFTLRMAFSILGVIFWHLAANSQALDVHWTNISLEQINGIPRVKMNLLIPSTIQNLRHIDFKIWGGGCEAKAHEIAYYLEGQGIQSAKIFIEGEGLRKRMWDFHVAVVVRDANETGIDSLLVIDPAFFNEPVNIVKWINAATVNDPNVQITITNRFTFLLPAKNGQFKNQWDTSDLKKACETNRWNSLFKQASLNGSSDALVAIMMGKQSLWQGSVQPQYCK